MLSHTSRMPAHINVSKTPNPLARLCEDLCMNDVTKIPQNITVTQHQERTQTFASADINSGYLEITDCVFLRGKSNYGPCIHTVKTNANIYRTSFIDNKAGLDGGAASLSQGYGYFEDCLFERNYGEEASGCVHLIDRAGYMAVRCTFKGNHAGYRGGVTRGVSNEEVSCGRPCH